MKKNQSRIRKNPPTSGGKTQRKKANCSRARLPYSATRRRLKNAAADQEREEQLQEKVRFIEQHGSAEFRLYLSDVITALAKMVGGRRAGDNGNLDEEHELFLTAEVIRQSRSMARRRATSYLRFFARLLPASRPARAAMLKAIAAPQKKRDAMLELIQVGGFRCVLEM